VADLVNSTARWVVKKVTVSRSGSSAHPLLMMASNTANVHPGEKWKAAGLAEAFDLIALAITVLGAGMAGSGDSRLSDDDWHNPTDQAGGVLVTGSTR